MLTADVPDLRGLWVPVMTPFDGAGEVDLAALERLCRRILSDGAAGIVALGTTGEPAVLLEPERRVVVDVCADVCSDLRRPLMVGVGTNSTRNTVDAAARLDAVPAVAAALVVVPYYTRPSPAGVVEHFRAVAAASPVPVVAYNVPYRTGRPLSAGDLLRIARLDNVAGLKQSVGGLDTDTLELLRDAPSGFHLFAGDDAFIAPTVLMGGAGAIAAAAHVCTPMFATLIRAALAGDSQRARPIAEALLPVVAAGFSEPSPAGWKAALHRAGEIATPDLRAPLTAAGSQTADLLETAIARATRWFEADRAA